MTVTAQSITLDDLLTIFFPEEPGNLLRLVAQGVRTYSDKDYFYAFRHQRWCWPPDGSIHADTPAQCVQRNRDTIVTWSPLVYLNSPMPTSPAILPLVWTCLPLRVEPSRFDPSMGAADAASERLALARIAAMSPEPTAVIHEGRCLTALWRLREPLTAPTEPIDEAKAGPWGDKPMARAQRALWALATRYGGDRRACDPRSVTFSVPNEPMLGIYPRRLVTATLSSDAGRRFDVDELL